MKNFGCISVQENSGSVSEGGMWEKGLPIPIPPRKGGFKWFSDFGIRWRDTGYRDSLVDLSLRLRLTTQTPLKITSDNVLL